MRNPASLTGQYMGGLQEIALPALRRTPNGKNLTIRGATENDLRDVDVTIPLPTSPVSPA